MVLNNFYWQVRDAAVNTIVEVYRHVGEKVRSDLGRRGIPAARCVFIELRVHSIFRNVS